MPPLNKHVSHTLKRDLNIYLQIPSLILSKLHMINMGRKEHPWWRVNPRKLFRSSSPPCHLDDSNAVIVLHTNNGSFSQELNSSPHQHTAGSHSHFLSKEDMAAITVQACFRAHLARRAYKALRSLVKLQALVRGVIVRRQARIALDCMHALARLQITVRARQLMLHN